MISLNPCFNGRYSRRYIQVDQEGKPVKVLILVLMEDTLGEDKRMKTIGGILLS